MTEMNVSWVELLKANGFSGLSGLMAMFTLIASGVIVLVICLLISLGFYTYQADPIHQTWSNSKSTVTISTAGAVSSDVRLTDPACVTEVVKRGGNDVSKCPLVPATAADLAAMKKSAASGMEKLYFMASILMNIAPASVLAFGLFQAGLCFLRLSQGHYFTPQTIRTLRNFAFAGLFYVIASPCVPFIYSLLTNLMFSIDLHFFKAQAGGSWGHPFPPTYSPLTFAVGSTTNFSSFLIAIYAFTLAIIAALMSKASAIAEDNAQII